MPGATQNQSAGTSSPRLLPFFQNRKMPSLFNIVRFCVYLTVILFTLICLSLAANFQHVLASSDLTRFVPFSIFVCSAGMFIIATLLGFSFAKGSRNPISTRIELACIGFVGVLWLILGIFLATSESQQADVECFVSELDTTPIDESQAAIRTSAYQAMYRVLMVFSLFNAIILLASFAILMYLALKRYYNGDEQMWYAPVTTCPWLTSYGSSDALLPGPGGAKPNPPMREKSSASRPSRSRHRREQNSTSRRAANQPPPIADAHTAGRSRTRDLYRRDASPRRS
jgi:hypothetical protein